MFVALDFNIEEDRAVDLMLGGGLSHDVMIEKCKQDFFKKGGAVYYKAARRRVFWTLFKSCTEARLQAHMQAQDTFRSPPLKVIYCSVYVQVCKCVSV